MATYFGNTTNTTTLGISANFAYFFGPFTCTLTGNVTDGRMTASSVTGTTALLKLAVYTDSAGTPNTLLGVSDAITLNAGATTYNTTYSTPFAVTNGTSYWLALNVNTASALVAAARASAPTAFRFQSSTYPAFPSPASSTSSASTWAVMEAGVTAAGGTFVPLIASMMQAWRRTREGVLVPELWVPHYA